MSNIICNQSITGTLTVSGNTTLQSNLHLGDSDYAYWGNANDFYIGHNATNTYILNSTGNIEVGNYADDKDIIFQCDDGSGGVATYFYLDGSAVNGTSVTGATKFPDKSKIYMGTGGDLEIFHGRN